GPPWISRIRGYFRFGSKWGGLTIHPWIFLRSSDDSYPISSTSPRVLCPRRSWLTAVMILTGDPSADPTLTSQGTLGREEVIAKPRRPPVEEVPSPSVP